jgi:hypothetical protein
MCTVVSPTNFDSSLLTITSNYTFANEGSSTIELLCPVIAVGSGAFDSVGVWFWSNGNETLDDNGYAVTAQLVDVTTGGTNGTAGSITGDSAGTTHEANSISITSSTGYSDDDFNYVLVTMSPTNTGANPYNVLYGWNVCLG